VLALFPESSQTGKRSARSKAVPVEGTQWLSDNHESTEYTDSGSAARFFYAPKASKKDRDEGLDAFEKKRTGGMQATADGSMLTGSGNERTTTRANVHPTVKPTDLMATCAGS
jgi:hypothetical protein